MNDESTISHLTRLSQTYASTSRRLTEDFPNWDPKQDERILVFVKCANVLSSIKMGLIYSRDYLSQPEWWNQYPELHNSVDFHPNRAIEFEIMMKASLAVLLFSIQEAALRCFVKAVDTANLALASKEFSKVYPYLLEQVYGSNQKREKHEALLQFWSLIRNSVHNNFVFSPRSRKNKTSHYRNKEYIFEVDRPVPFLSWELFLLVTADLGDLLNDLVHTTMLSSIPTVKTSVDMHLYLDHDQ
jgi:hypothetical protein